MLRKSLSLLLILTVFGTANFVCAANSVNDELTRAEKIKTEISRLGTGPNAKIKIKLRDKTKIEGYVSEIHESDFVVVNQHNGSSTTVAYPQIGSARGNNLSGGVKIAIGVGLAIGVTYLYYKFSRRRRIFY